MVLSKTKIREIKLTNSLTGKKETLETLVPGKLKMYSCGPTVYNFIHIGNLRGGVVADLFYRYFQRVGYEVNYVRNYTDVDDKIIRKANEEKVAPEVISRRFTQEVEKDYALAGMAEPTHKTTVTDHMNEIISMIEKIVARGCGYVAPDGEVLFAIDRFEGYGKLSRKPLQDLVAGIRVEVSDKKQNPLDFTLWKPAKPGEPAWESPWGRGRPGWHIECSAMSTKWLGDQMDVHHGGEDLIFPHHENEVAQSEAATGKRPFVKVWLHHAFVTMSNEKMSKSLGNVFLARDFLSRYGGEVARYLLLSAHYRSAIDFTEDSIQQAFSALGRIYEAKKKAAHLLQVRSAQVDLRAESAWGSFVQECERVKTEMDDHYANDFNTPGVLASVFTLIREFNRVCSEPHAEQTPTAVLGAQAFLKVLEEDLGGVMGVGRKEPNQVLTELARMKAESASREGIELPTVDEIQSSIQARREARERKDFAEADRLRKSLEARGVVLKDGPQGTTWEYR